MLNSSLLNTTSAPHSANFGSSCNQVKTMTAGPSSNNSAANNDEDSQDTVVYAQLNPRANNGSSQNSNDIIIQSNNKPFNSPLPNIQFNAFDTTIEVTSQIDTATCLSTSKPNPSASHNASNSRGSTAKPSNIDYGITNDDLLKLSDGIDSPAVFTRDLLLKMYEGNYDTIKKKLVYACNRVNVNKEGLDSKDVEFLKKTAKKFYTIDEKTWLETIVPMCNKALRNLDKKMS